MKTIDEFAKELSHKLHANQKRNDGVTPYTVHTDYVSANCVKYFTGQEPLTEKVIRILKSIGDSHDILEDVDITESELLDVGKEYGQDWEVVVHCVRLLSRFSKSDSIIDYLSAIKNCPATRAVKLADLEHNLSDLKPGNLRDKYLLCRHFLIGYEVESFDEPPLMTCVDNTSRDYIGVSDLK